MAEPPTPAKSLFRMPTLGGKLALVNANFWIILFLFMRGGAIPEWFIRNDFFAIPLNILMLFFACPIGIWALLPSLGPPHESDIVWGAVCLGINAFAWGYGLAWIWYRIKPWLPKKIREHNNGA